MAAFEFTEEMTKDIPPICGQEGKGLRGTIAYLKVEALNGWRWLITEYDQNDLFFGYVLGFENEWGYISLTELEGIMEKGHGWIDTDFEPVPLIDAI